MRSAGGTVDVGTLRSAGGTVDVGTVGSAGVTVDVGTVRSEKKKTTNGKKKPKISNFLFRSNVHRIDRNRKENA